jgi:putative ABC transport system permease protein
MLSDLFSRIRSLVRRSAVEQELDEELRFHLGSAIEKHVASGLTPAEAARRARLEWGGLDQLKEACRDARGVEIIESCIQDLRYGIRTLSRTPTFTIVALLTLGFTTAAVAAVFTLWHTLFVRDLPVDEPETLVTVAATREQGRDLGFVSYADYAHFRDAASSLEGLAAHYSGAPFFVTLDGRSQEVSGAVVSANFFSLLHLRPAMGRFFEPREDEVPGRDRVAVLGFEFWQDWFGASRDALNSTIRINATSFTVIGVAPEGFRGLDATRTAIYLPTMMLGVGDRFCQDPLSASNCTILQMIGRVAEGRTVQQVKAEVETLKPAHWPESRQGENTGVTAFRPRDAGRYDNFAALFSQTRLIDLLLGVAALLLFACCANLAGLLVTRNLARGREFAIRAAIGAGRMRLARQLLTEASLLAAAGGALGLVLSRAIVAALGARYYAIDMEGRQRYFDFSLAPAVVVGVLAVTVVTGGLFAMVPALRAAFRARDESLNRQASSAAPSSRLAGWLVGTQVAVAVALVASAALLVAGGRAMVNDRYHGARMALARVAVLRVRPLLIGYDLTRSQQFQRDLMLRLNSAPGVESASPYAFCAGRVSLPEWTDGQSIRTACMEIGPRYFETLGIPIAEGRDFTGADAGGAPLVAIVSQTFARRLSPGRSALGTPVGTASGIRSVVGVVNDTMLTNRGEETTPEVYVPFLQNPRHADARYVVRVKGDPGAMLPSLVREVGRVDPDVPVTGTMTRLTQAALGASNLRLTRDVAGYAALLAMVLTAIGLYGVLSFSVHRRAKELGIRMALGATAENVRRMLLQQGTRVIAVGTLAGLGLAAGSTRFIAHLLFFPPAADLTFYAVAGTLVALVALLACWLPARRAARVEPMSALRSE